MLPANLLTTCDENERVGSGAGRATTCEALGLLPVSEVVQQVPITYPRRGPHLSVWAQDPVLVQSSCGQPFILRANIFRTKRICTFWPTKQPGKANQRYKEVSLPIGQRAMLKKVSKPEMQDRPWSNGSLATLMGGI